MNIFQYFYGFLTINERQINLCLLVSLCILNPCRTGSPSGVIGHRRSDSGSSGQSLQSRNGEDFVSIDYASTRSGFVDVRHRKSITTG